MRNLNPRSIVLALVAFLQVSGSAVASTALVSSHPQSSAAPLGIVAGTPGKPVGSGSGLSGVKTRYPTFNKEVVRILQSHCQTCHHDGDIAPFPLMTYQDSYPYREQIVEKTGARLMPPWHVDNRCAKFEGDPSLTDEEIQTIASWVSAGAPEGSPQDAPAPLNFTGGWKLGVPDLELRMPEAFTPSFTSGDVYRCFVLPTNTTQDRWVKSVEVLPGNRSMVHHVLLFIDTTNQATDKDASEPGPGYACFGGPGFTLSVDTGLLAGWAPGARPQILPDGVGTKLPKGAKVVMQVHYSAQSGVIAPDNTSVGVNYATAPVHKQFRTIPLVNQTFKIPAGNPDYPVTASIPFIPVGVHILGVFPHMHLLGKTMKIETTAIDGTKKCLINVPDWDFHWQGTYTYPEPVGITPGMRIDMRATYDNSAQNPENPNSPPKDVTWGENTKDEMCLAFLGITLDYENLVAQPADGEKTLREIGFPVK